MKYGFLVASAVVACCPAWAGQLSLGYLTVTGVDTTRGTYTDYLRDGQRFNSFAGVVFGFADYATPIPLLSADLYRNFPLGTAMSRDEVPATANQERIAWLYTYQLGGITTPEEGAGLQMAIWDVMADNGDGLGLGYLQASPDSVPAVLVAWQHYLDISVGQGTTDASFFYNRSVWFGLDLGTMIGRFGGPLPPMDIIDPEVPGEDVGEIPEPSTITMFIVGFAGLLAIKLRK